jgi:hypothetical protein
VPSCISDAAEDYGEIFAANQSAGVMHVIDAVLRHTANAVASKKGFQSGSPFCFSDRIFPSCELGSITAIEKLNLKLSGESVRKQTDLPALSE